jgi:hypothetical protein
MFLVRMAERASPGFDIQGFLIAKVVLTEAMLVPAIWQMSAMVVARKPFRLKSCVAASRIWCLVSTRFLGRAIKSLPSSLAASI